MKKIKFFALAAFAMLSTNAFAQFPADDEVAIASLTSGTSQTIDNVEYTVISVYKTPTAAKVNKVMAKANNFTGTELVIPNTVTFDVKGTDSDGADIEQECTFNVVAIQDNAFEGNATITSVSIPANVERIGASAFEGCELLSTVTLAASSKLSIIDDGAFSWTSITSLDLTNATEYHNGVAKVGMTQFGNKATATTGPLTSATHGTNAMIEEVKLPSTCVTVKAYALANCTALKTIDLKTVKTIEGNAFNGDIALASVVIGTAPATAFAAGEGISVGADAFAGCTALKTVELGQLIAASIDVAAFTGTAIETVKYNEIAAVQTTTPFAALTTIKEVHFQKYISVAGAVCAGSFEVLAAGAQLTKIYYNASTVVLPEAAYVQPFAATAFDTNGSATRPAKLFCLDDFYTDANGFNTNPNALNGVTIAASADVVIGKDGKLIKDKNSSNYYYYYQPAGITEIARSQESGATVTVYQAYIDIVTAEDKANIYMIPLMVSDGMYVVDAGQTVIIKSNQEDGVVAAPAAGASTMLMNAGAIVNGLDLTAAKVSPLTVKTGAAYLNSGANDLYFLNNPASSGFGFTKYDTTKQTGGLAANCVYMVCAHTAAARVEVIWLDNSDATAIIGAKKLVKNDGAIYNLAGQKVNASYKGVVIKDGKKYIQK